jgi:N-acetylglucosamine kinase-like BadF-type ATPase
MTEREFLLGVEGDGNRTQVLVADMNGTVLARGLGPGSNIHAAGGEEFGKAMATAIGGALLSVVGPHDQGDGPSWGRVKIAAACFGLAGVDGPEDEAQVAKWVTQEAITSNFRVLNDSELNLAAGTPDGWGVALICGTGSVCLGRTADGRARRVGGWGPLLGDEGSGYAMATRALGLATQTADGRAEAKDLLMAVLRHWSLPDAQALIRHVYAPSMKKSDIAALAEVVLSQASRGDGAAVSVIEEAAGELSKHVRAVMRLLHLEKPPLALSGASLRGSLRRALQAQLGAEVGAIQYVADPALGAVTLARRAASRS